MFGRFGCAARIWCRRCSPTRRAVHFSARPTVSIPGEQADAESLLACDPSLLEEGRLTGPLVNPAAAAKDAFPVGFLAALSWPSVPGGRGPTTEAPTERVVTWRTRRSNRDEHLAGDYSHRRGGCLAGARVGGCDNRGGGDGCGCTGRGTAGGGCCGPCGSGLAFSRSQRRAGSTSQGVGFRETEPGARPRTGCATRGYRGEPRLGERSRSDSLDGTRHPASAVLDSGCGQGRCFCRGGGGGAGSPRREAA